MTSPRTDKPQNAPSPGSNPQRESDSNRDASTPSTQDRVQGEGNYDAAREFDEAEHKFVESGKVDAAARAAAPRSDAEEREMLEAEQIGKSRAKGEDPAVRRATPGKAKP